MRGLLLRICLIVAMAIVVMVAAGFAIYFAQWQDTLGSGLPLPVPNQVVAIVEVVEKTPEADLPRLLTALNSSYVRVAVSAKEPDSDGTVSMPLMTRLVAGYLRALGGRKVRAMVDVSEGPCSDVVNLRGGRFLAMHPMRLVVELRDGRSLTIDFRSSVLMRFTGFRMALMVLVVTLLVGAASLWAVQRQIRPIQKLAAAVDQFGTSLDRAPIEEEGASDVRRLILAFNRMQGRIRDLVEGRTRMMAAISHDLGTYLTRLRLRAEFIADEDQRERAIRDIEDMSGLMNDTLTLARLDNNGEELDVVDLAPVARRAVEATGVPEAKLRLHLPDGPVSVCGKEAALGRALANLISNALKYGGEADVTLSREGGIVRLLVEDRGPGIPAAQREAVLEAFYRLDTARNLDAGGFGLGLAIVADVVRHHKGKITLGDREGGGLKVDIELPAASE
ncbi:HAMP domain-containing protein [Parvibaculum sedimenti]|uniref:histidine kinase n=1 Tax=Parvibaculum sedimenti TaxID=2608632 RepID=A0A6N6VJH3_9HYPH|nr:ATP-binding protein [Parvibaculum sedimenti]KAB7739076.1 HAMP domain-containing protein [Parvibaculum sedimenti]